MAFDSISSAAVDGGGYFAWSLQTIRLCERDNKQDQKRFLIRIAMVYTPVLLYIPVFLALFADVLQPWAEEKWVRALEMTGNLAANTAMLWLLWPRANAENAFLQVGNFKAAAASPFPSSTSSRGRGPRTTNASQTRSSKPFMQPMSM